MKACLPVCDPRESKYSDVGDHSVNLGEPLWPGTRRIRSHNRAATHRDLLHVYHEAERIGLPPHPPGTTDRRHDPRADKERFLSLRDPEMFTDRNIGQILEEDELYNDGENNRATEGPSDRSTPGRRYLQTSQVRFPDKKVYVYEVNAFHDNPRLGYNT